MPFFNSRKNVFARETLTVSNSVKTLTSTLYDNVAGITSGTQPVQTGSNRRRASGAVVITEGQAIRATKDGTDPVATTTGTKLNTGDIYILETYQDIAKFKAIREGASDGTIQVEYYR